MKYQIKKKKKNTFKQTWRIITLRDEDDVEESLIRTFNTIDNDIYFKKAYIPQESLTESFTYNNKIDYSNFIQLSPAEINKKNIYDCFHGVLAYIYFYSENKLNNEELEFHFTGAESNNIQKNNILNIFEYKNINLQFHISSIRNAFFGVTFKRTKIKPISYSIRSGLISNNTTHLISFTFEGYDSINQKWDVLDEQVNLNDLIPSGGYNMFFVRSTEKCYSSFKIVQTEPGNTGFWGFSIAAFDIHGIVYMNDNSYDQLDLNLNENEDIPYDYDYNPLMDMSEFLL